MRNLFLIVLFFVCTSALNAQAVQGFNVGSATQNNICVVLGQPFDAITADNGYEVAEGIAQAQLVTVAYVDSVYKGEPYANYGFKYPATTPLGIYNDSLYTVGGATYGYDSFATLTLKVLKFVCGWTVRDGDRNAYPTLELAGLCWTRENLRARHYTDTEEIATAMVYESALHPDTAANDSIYGRLYSWYSAVRVPEGSATAPATDTNGYVQGVCPVGWHIPTEAEMDTLMTIPAEDVRTAGLWVSPNANTNSTGFTALPAGLHNASLDRFEGLGSQTDWWSVRNTSGTGTDITTAYTCCTVYYCDRLLDRQHHPADALSVRCVRTL